jgi:hypothetical protein
MLQRFGLQDKIHAVTADNAASNDTQVKALDKMDNSFKDDAHVRCFNHTLQLSAKVLLRPFNAAICSKKSAGHNDDDSGQAEEMPDLVEVPYEDDEDEDEDEDDDEDTDDRDDSIDEIHELAEHEQEELMAETAAVRLAVTKVCSFLLFLGFPISTAAQLRQLSFAIIHSTTIALPAWRRACESHKLSPNLIPRDVVTRWNSTYDMMQFALKYRKPIDTITADKSLKSLRKYELDDDEWNVIKQLVSVLHVSSLIPLHLL